VDDIDRIHRATKLGGAFDFINELPLGFETDIETRSDAWSSMHKAKEGGPLKTKLKELEGEFDISGERFRIWRKCLIYVSTSFCLKKCSGGQWQRLAISRTLMRAMDNDDIRLLCFDEPSSALDPKAEFELFERLRDFRGQKTLIFITQYVVLHSGKALSSSTTHLSIPIAEQSIWSSNEICGSHFVYEEWRNHGTRDACRTPGQGGGVCPSL
jgi:hypothetical protein